MLLLFLYLEYWLQYYTSQSYILILDFRDTFFQANPFQSFGSFSTRVPKYELHVFAEHHGVSLLFYFIYLIFISYINYFIRLKQLELVFLIQVGLVNVLEMQHYNL